jgi:hypothetical protein
MHPIHDVDVSLLLATALSSKRRPADLAEILAAADLIQGAIPSPLKLGEAFSRLSSQGLIAEVEGRFTLTPDGQKIMAGQRRKADTPERSFAIREKLSGYEVTGQPAPILLTADQLAAAIAAHQAAQKAAGIKRPEPKAPEAGKRTGQWRRPTTARGRKE